MNTKVIDKLKKEGKCRLSAKEKTDLLEIIFNYHELTNKLKIERDIFKNSSLRNLKAMINIEKEYKRLLKEQLSEADKRFEQAKEDYVHDKIHISKLSEIQGYYHALVDLKKNLGGNK